MGYYHVFFLTLVLNLYTIVRSQENSIIEAYIVHVDLPSIPILNHTNLQTWYQTFLSSTSTTNNPQILYSFHNVFYGFAARLSPEQAKQMEKVHGFISARPQKSFSPHTTHSPNFLGLNQNIGFWNESNYGRGIIIGLLDTGINPDHPSFSDEGVPPPPAKWKGRCDFNSTLCNNKLIGARSFTVGNDTPFDEDGHGTHTASTAAGNFVRGANVNGNANGTAAGIAPLAHIAIYKVCGESCKESDILAAMDIAIDDGVDVLSLSLGGPADKLYEENIAVGAFSAIRKGIFVSASAGNDGPSLRTISNGAPWFLTVGASSIDRKIVATAVLGNNEQLNGESASQPVDFDSSTLLPLIYPGMLSNNSNASFCTPESLLNVDVRGSIVFCVVGVIERVEQGVAVRDAGGLAMILTNQQTQNYTTSSDAHVLPATHLSFVDGVKVVTYIRSTVNPVATILFKGTIIGDKGAPEVAYFSARGPNVPSPGILKPDIIGPGSNILAAWHIS